MRKKDKISELLSLASQPDRQPIDISPERLAQAIEIVKNDPEMMRDPKIISALNILNDENIEKQQNKKN